MIKEGWYQTQSSNWYNKKVCKGYAAHIVSTCDECGDEFFERKYKTKGKKGGQGNHYCSRSCMSKSTIKEQNLSHLAKHYFPKGQIPYNYKGGYRRKLDGRKVIYVDGKRKLAYRQIMEQHLERKLNRWEVVHHISGDVSDDRLENLQIMSLSEHTRLHHEGGDSMATITDIYGGSRTKAIEFTGTILPLICCTVEPTAAEATATTLSVTFSDLVRIRGWNVTIDQNGANGTTDAKISVSGNTLTVAAGASGYTMASTDDIHLMVWGEVKS